MLDQAGQSASKQALLPVVLTFSPHPAEVLGRSAPPLLTPLERKVELITSLAPPIQVVVQTFDLAFSQKTPEQFAQFLRQDLGVQSVFVGQNFHFGRGRTGDFSTLTAFGKQLGFEVHAIQLAGDEQGVWSSTRVRGALAQGKVAEAQRILGRPHELEGTVVRGQQRARQLGFPTANLAGIPQALPSYGVYAVRVCQQLNGAEQFLGGGVANIGVRPTVAAGFAVEAHIFGVNANLYGTKLRIQLLQRLREERTFTSLNELEAQITRDVEAAHTVLNSRTETQ